ncbi:hypothetical protein EB796_003051 [Bugula neritina]|uniref:Uncharacterized protein n=1 Tax=Bugula neritina TaxID=10212 RepID=A0A7J7KLE5_BUGNE|nr:hypothetical protein EB796_003051 [Bugula neritina]
MNTAVTKLISITLRVHRILASFAFSRLLITHYHINRGLVVHPLASRRLDKLWRHRMPSLNKVDGALISNHFQRLVTSSINLCL